MPVRARTVDVFGPRGRRVQAFASSIVRRPTTSRTSPGSSPMITIETVAGQRLESPVEPVVRVPMSLLREPRVAATFGW